MSTVDSADGVVDVRDDGKRVLRFERRLRHPIARVWAALTSPEELLGWWGSADVLELAEGGRIVLRWLNEDHEGNHVVLHGTVTAYEPPHVLEFDTDVHGVLRFELAEDGSATVLRFSSTVGFPDDVLPLVLAGWHLHLNFLASALAGSPADLADLPMAEWQRFHDQYEDRLTRA
ncbi:SRPBCC family protein [Amycolatopsis sp. NPDC051903]|uniref:SRPBCC family protein n=1 Tax=Amycolatopsis sp. NPDC051903 TaxID=3363936 RepID=UPI0037ABF65F